MAVDSVNEVVRRIESWTESLPPNKIDVFVSRDVRKNNEYPVDCEIKLIPKNPKSLGITIWVYGDAIGIFVESYIRVANLVDAKVSSTHIGLACAGTEPIIRMDVESVLTICQDLSTAKLNVYAGTALGHLKGVYATINTNKNENFNSSIGFPKGGIKFLSKIGVAKLRAVPYEPW